MRTVRAVTLVPETQMKFARTCIRFVSQQLPLRSTAHLRGLTAMSLIPFAPFTQGYSQRTVKIVS